MLRAKDRAAPDTLRHWAYLHELGGGDPLMSQMAREQAARMEGWQAKYGSKIADL